MYLPLWTWYFFEFVPLLILRKIEDEYLNCKKIVDSRPHMPGSEVMDDVLESRRASSRGLIPKAKVKTIKMTFVIITGYSLSEVLILISINPKYDDILSFELRLQHKKTTSPVLVVYIHQIVSKQKQFDLHNMYWTCSFLVLNSQFNEQSVVILWVSWCKNKSFWQRFTSTYSQK